jgi:putative flippase GtrA
MQFLVFAAVGAIGTAGHYVTLVTLVAVFQLDAVFSSVAGFLVGAMINYWLNYHVTFRSKSPHLNTAWKFFTLAAVGLLLNTLLMSWAVNTLKLHYLLSQVAATGLVLLWNYLANRAWTFRRGNYV